MPIELASPKGLWLLGLVVPLVALYILKVRRQRLRVSSTWLWAGAERDLLAKSPFRKLIAQVPLILQLLALALLALALTRPATRGGTIIGDHVAIVVDTSASMGARDPSGETRMAAAKQAAHDVIAALAPGSDAMLVDAGREARIASPLDRDRRRLDLAIDRLEVREVEGKLGRAVALASDRLRQLPGSKRLIVITDGALADRGALAAVTLPLTVVKVGAPASNAAVVRVDVRSGRDPATRRDQTQVFAMVANRGDAKRDLFVTLRQRNVSEPLASRRVQLAPGERSPVILTFEPAPGDQGSGLVVELSPSDALAVDDRAYAKVPAGRRLTVVMAPPGKSPWLERAFGADPDVELLGASLAELDRADVPADALVAVTGACPARLPGADFLIVAPPKGRCRSSVVGEPLDKPSITSWSPSDPRLRFLTLDGVELASASRIEPDGPADSLVRSRDGTVMSDLSSPGRSGTLLGFEPGDSNWPLKASFVLFARNLLELARAHRESGITGPARTGEPVSVRVPPDLTEVELEDPSGKRVKLPARAGLAVVPEVARAGFYFVSWKGARPGSALIAANLTSDAESDLSPRDLEVGEQAPEVESAARLADARTDWTWLIAALALALLGADAWWLTRRPRRAAALAPKPRLPDRSAA
ncbi:MAG: VWA domain-containing protein [Sorangiineae bacterium]|nr:VWA domain-containing protein [Polyangiaceae bacterium]MEB2323605.1 VWA domain-containing protein [Sorangiineae bacterium]